VTGPAIAALAVAAAFAVANWVAKARGDRGLEYVAKPAALGALIVVAVALDPEDPAQRWWFVAALVLSLAGDILLMLPSDQFVAGLAAFLLAHVAYVVGFWLDPPDPVALLVAAIAVFAVIVPLATRIVRALRASAQRELVTPVVAYIAVISAMVVSAVASGDVLAASGAVLFAGSDSMIAWDRFVGSFAIAPIAIMVTYHLGQALLVVSLAH
jgi:uncharacterized membrane protein YhhN